MEHKVVAHTLDGRILKGITHDFDPGRERFHILPTEGGGVPIGLRVEQLKALFYVKDYLGNREYDPPPGFGTAPSRGRRCVVTFIDGEVIFGTSPDYVQGATGFTLFPSDTADNNVRIFVCRDAVQSVEFPD
ncbi:MAG: hypothetical protein JSV80_13035 [Acidobacteriota bacterium]|nr:MAG: hypothetical protein JSV80_13035 [Acidobacteriota bacterium]